MWVVTPYFETLIARNALGQLAGLPSEAGGARAPVSSAGGTAWAGHAGERGGDQSWDPPRQGDSRVPWAYRAAVTPNSITGSC